MNILTTPFKSIRLRHSYIINKSINQYKFYSERNITENIKIFLCMIMTDLLTSHQDLVRGGSYYIILKSFHNTK